MTDNFVILPDDSSNTGKLIRTNQRTVAGSNVEEHYMILQDATNDFQAQIISGNVNTATGLAVWAIQAGSYSVYGGGSEVYVKAGSIQTYDPVGVGSVLGLFTDSSNTLDSPLIANGSYLMVAGSISSMPPVTTGSEVYVKAGSIQTYNPVGIGSVQLVPGSLEVYQTVGADMVVNINTDPVPISGNALGVSGTAFNTVWLGVGSTVISGTSIPVSRGIGSVRIAALGVTPLPVSGTATISAGANSVFGVSGTVVGVSGIVNQGTTPWTISGVVNVGSIVGSIAISNFAAIGSQRTISAGSIIVTNELTIGNVGSPCYKRATLVASGTYTNVWPIGGVGSRFEMHGFHISTDNPGYVRIANSGTALATTQAGVIADYHLNYASGAAIEKTFSTSIIPNGAGSPVGFGTTVAGSTLVTFYGREVK